MYAQALEVDLVIASAVALRDDMIDVGIAFTQLFAAPYTGVPAVVTCIVVKIGIAVIAYNKYLLTF